MVVMPKYPDNHINILAVSRKNMYTVQIVC